MEYLYDKLLEYSRSDFYPFHMPGHKRNREITGAALPYDIDITEIDGFDDLHHAVGILSEAQRRAASLYHAEETHFPCKWEYCWTSECSAWICSQAQPDTDGEKLSQISL